MPVGQNIRLIRKSRKMNRRKLAKKAGVNYRTLENIEVGRSRNPGIYVIQRVAKTLNVPVDILLQENVSNGVNIAIPPEIFKVISDSKTRRLFMLMKETHVK
jgi:transcriptional regulator with XRE-family HTH domain